MSIPSNTLLSSFYRMSEKGRHLTPAGREGVRCWLRAKEYWRMMCSTGADLQWKTAPILMRWERLRSIESDNS